MKNFVLIVLLLLSGIAFSQDPAFVVRGATLNQDIGKKEGGVKVALVQDGKEIVSTVTASNGKFALSGVPDYKRPFYLVYSKAGLVSKRMKFNFSAMNPEDTPAGNELDFLPSLEINLFKDRSNVDFSFLDNEPVADFSWNAKKMQPNLDDGAAAAMSRRIEQLLIDAEKNKAEAEAKYQKAIAEADAAYGKKEYQQALAKYEESLTYKPGEKYPSDKILELDALIQAQKQKELATQQADSEYNNLISAADNLRDKGELEKAITTYEQAIAKKNEQYPKDQITKLTAQIEAKKKEAENQTKYTEAIKMADGFLKQNSLRAARDKYEEASKLKPSEQYPKDKLAEIEGKMKQKEEQEAVKQKYDDAIAAGDAAFASEDFETAKKKYEEALSFEGSSTYAKARVKLCDEKLAAAKKEAERVAKIAELIKKGNDEFSKDQLTAAKATFTEVLTLEAENAVAKEKLAQIEVKLKDAEAEAKKEADFKKLVQEGDVAVKANKLEDGLAKYQAAIALKPSTEVDTKIADVQAKIADKKSAAEKDAKYAELVASGSTKLTAGDLAGAKTAFQEASALKPSEQLPKDKLTEIQKLEASNLAAQQKKEQYEALISEANAKLAANDLNGAKAKYQEAAKIDPAQKLPAEKIAEIDGLLANEKANEEKAAKYNKLITDGTAQLTGGELEKAKKTFQEAAKVDPSQAVPAQKIAEIDALIAAKQKESEQAAQYDKLMSEATKLMTAKDLEGAKAKYTEASALKPSEQLPKDKIAELDGLIAAKKNEEKLNADYANLIADGSALLAANDLTEAKSKFVAASALKPGESVPKEKIKQIDELIAAKNAQESKATQYANLITEGNTKLAADNLTGAKAAYEAASKLDPSQSLPKEKIAEIEKMLADREAAKGAAEKQKAYSEAMADGERLVAESKLEEALTKFKAAVAIDGTQAGAKQRVAEVESLINKNKENASRQKQIAELLKKGSDLMTQKELNGALSAYEQVLALDPSNIEAQTQKAAIEKEIQLTSNAAQQKAQLEANYTKLIADGRAMETSNDLAAAKENYEKALKLKPSESLPKERIAAIDKKLTEMAANEAEVNKLYDKSIARGRELMAAENYLEAIKEFNTALGLKPNEKLPSELADEAARLAQAKGTEEDSQYEKILTVAQKKIDEREYDKAIELLERAKGFRPDGDRPEKMLAEIERLKKLDKEYADLMAKGEAKATSKAYADAKKLFQQAKTKRPSETLPDERIAEMDRLISASAVNPADQLYADNMEKGDKVFAVSRYGEALEFYKNALSAKPGDKTAQSKINEVQQIMDDLANADVEAKKNKEKFDKLIKEADALFAQKKYLPEAKNKYDEALSIISTNSYALFQTAECSRLGSAIGDVEKEKQYLKLIAAADKSFDGKDYEKAKDYYTRAVNVKNSDSYPKDRLAEIEGILKGTVVESLKLEDLGDPYDGSILDGNAILQTAEEQRALMKGYQIAKKIDAIQDSEVDATAKKANERERVTNEIYRLQQMIGRGDAEANENREALLAALRKAERERDEMDRADLNYERSENLSTQSTVDRVKNAGEIKYGEDLAVYGENAEKVNSITKAERRETSSLSTEYAGRKLSTDKELATIEKKIEENAISDFEERVELREGVFASERKVIDTQESISSDNYSSLLAQKQVVNDVVNKYDTKVNEDALKSGNNNEYVKSINTSISEKTIEQGVSEQDHLYATDNQIAEVRRKTQLDANVYNANREGSVEAFKLIQVSNAEETLAAVDRERLKYSENQEVLSREKAVAPSQSALSDEDQRLRARKDVELVAIGIDTKATADKKRSEDNVEVLSDSKKAVNQLAISDADMQKSKTFENQDALSNVDNKPKEKLKVANSLGQEYPEGVSQESFTRKDQNGLITAVITRRVVVINGHADVYVRTQTNDSVTYSKNGIPSLAHVWNSETQSPDLERHF